MIETPLKLLLVWEGGKERGRKGREGERGKRERERERERDLI
jgi:hypothetical protein